jgi:hypothetical protein
MNRTPAGRISTLRRGPDGNLLGGHASHGRRWLTLMKHRVRRADRRMGQCEALVALGRSTHQCRVLARLCRWELMNDGL